MHNTAFFSKQVTDERSIDAIQFCFVFFFFHFNIIDQNSNQPLNAWSTGSNFKQYQL